VKPFAAYFCLTFESGEVEMGIRLKGLFRTEQQQALNKLRQQILMMKGDISTPVLKRKNNPCPHTFKK
jgi:hypothetical protein